MAGPGPQLADLPDDRGAGGPGEPDAQIAAAAGGRVTRITSGEQLVDIAGARKWIYAYEIDSRDSLTEGIYVRVSGRMPADAGETAVSVALAELAPIGSTIRIRWPPGGSAWSAWPSRSGT
ncbi:hypothetical protein Acor_20100 [Acrocarpospora corrugata]|uniref:Uncharacterized protein n=1 Tax=Acrocarpospora corrugata TaxID=35763 RepID=A0A5M3VT39_9ACTN|nr:hypothetical protein Acor_20100 [Acrocarpospora corrugata]